MRTFKIRIIQCSMTFWCGPGSGSAPLTTGSGFVSGSGSLTFKTPTKNKYKKVFFAYYFFKVNLHHFSKIKSQEEITKQ